MSVNLLSLSEVAKSLPGKPSIPTVWRWCRKGTKVVGRPERIKLRHVRMGGRIYVAPEWIEEYATALAQADAAHFEEDAQFDASPFITPRTRTAEERERAIAAAEARLGVRAGDGR